MIKVFAPSSGQVELLVTGVSTANLTSSRAIADLIGELHSEMAATRVSFAQLARSTISKRTFSVTQ
ncbi:MULTISPECIES: DUF1652 domain-containing protein [unclassified Pseudomonas]|jgi:hypothetical protein